jgi:hypothetical protein
MNLSVNMDEPISPEDVKKIQEKSIPAEVFQAFNECISENFTNNLAQFSRQEVVSKILKKLPQLTEVQERWLNIENIYSKKGWTVKYVNPYYQFTYRLTR